MFAVGFVLLLAAGWLSCEYAKKVKISSFEGLGGEKCMSPFRKYAQFPSKTENDILNASITNIVHEHATAFVHHSNGKLFLS